MGQLNKHASGTRFPHALAQLGETLDLSQATRDRNTVTFQNLLAAWLIKHQRNVVETVHQTTMQKLRLYDPQRLIQTEIPLTGKKNPATYKLESLNLFMRDTCKVFVVCSFTAGMK